MTIFRDFVSEENREFKYRLGQAVASSLTGFICGAIATSIVWMVAVSYVFNQ